MCKAIEDMLNQVIKEEMLKIADRMLKNGKYTIEEIAYILNLSIEEVKALDEK